MFIRDRKVAGKAIPLPPAKAKKVIEGGYAGKTVTFGIRPEDVYDSQMFIETAKCTFEATIKVYELLGAEVYLYFDLAEDVYKRQSLPSWLVSYRKECFCVRRMRTETLPW